MFHKTHADGFQPEEVDLLQRVFDGLCLQGGITRDSIRAELLAAVLIQSYQSGVTNEAALLRLGHKRMAEIAVHPALIDTGDMRL